MGNFIIQTLQLLITLGLVGFVIYVMYSCCEWANSEKKVKKLAKKFAELSYDEKVLFHKECVKILSHNNI